jgi:hypothetical protein
MQTLGVTLPDEFLEAAKRIIVEGERKGVPLRLLGGLAFKAMCDSAGDPRFARSYKDIDLYGLRQHSKSIMKIMETLGYMPREVFNRLSMGRRLIYYDHGNKRRVDIFLDEFEMCHKFNFKDRISMSELTLPMTDLVMTKLQVVEMTDKEYKDLMAAFKDFDVTHDQRGINADRIAEVCSKDWGIYKTFTRSLELVKEAAFSLNDPSTELIVARISKLAEAIEQRPKNLAWKLRATVGERARWYELPEPDKGLIA